MPSLRHLIGIGILGLAVTGCVPAEQYAAVKMRAEQLAEQLAHSQTEIAEANAKAKFNVWTMPTDWRATESPDPVNYRMVDGRLEPLTKDECA